MLTPDKLIKWHNHDKTASTNLVVDGHTETLFYGPHKNLDDLKDPEAWHLNWVDVLDQMQARYKGVVIPGFAELRAFHVEAAELLKAK